MQLSEVKDSALITSDCNGERIVTIRQQKPKTLQTFKCTYSVVRVCTEASLKKNEYLCIKITLKS